ncbi:MAG: hypothetical protein QMD82_02990 [bacterium]|nr:hypothetical protein [bacterium]
MFYEPLIYNERGPWIIKGKRIMLNLSGGDILGLASSNDFTKTFFQFLEKFDLFFYPHFKYDGQTLKVSLDTLCELKGHRKAILFKDTHTLFNLLISHLLKKGYTLLFDEQFELAKILPVRNFTNQVQIFPHDFFSNIKTHLDTHPDNKLAVFVQTVYPLSSQLLPVSELIEISKDERIIIVVFESWADGLLGEGGEGIKSLTNTLPQNWVITGTFAHLLPFSASYVVSSESFSEIFESDLREHSFNPGPSEFQAGITLWFVRFLNSEKSPLRKLNDNANYLRYELAARGFKVLGDFTPLIPILIGERDKAEEFYNALLENKIFTNLLNYPLVPLGKSKILLIPSVLHSKEDLDIALIRMEKVAKSLDII